MRNNHLIRAQFLRSEMEAAGVSRVHELELRKASELRAAGEVEQAGAICQRLLAQRDLSPVNRIQVYTLLGLMAFPNAPLEVEQYFKQALELTQQGGYTVQRGWLYHNLARVCRNTNRFGEASEYYKTAIGLAKKTEDMRLLASATNELAYLHWLQGDLSQADPTAE